MSLSVKRVVNGKWKQNCFIAGNAYKEALIIDPGSNAEEIKSVIETEGWQPLAVINTHAHYDHIGAVKPLTEAFAIPFYLHKGDAKLLGQANLYKLLFESTETVRIPEISHDLALAETPLQIGGFEIGILFTPGHTEGSVCFTIEDAIFTGDTLLPGGPGRVDLPGGNAAKLQESVKKLVTVPAETTVYPGHGRPFPLSQGLEKLSSVGASV